MGFFRVGSELFENDMGILLEFIPKVIEENNKDELEIEIKKIAKIKHNITNVIVSITIYLKEFIASSNT